MTTRSYDRGKLLYLGSIAIAALLLWDTGILYPLHLLVVFFHELSHAIAAWCTGGHVQAISINSAEGGYTLVEGGIALVTASAGYLGSLLCGAALVLYATFARRLRFGVAAMGVVLLVTTAIFFRPFPSFGAIFCLATGIGLLAVAIKCSHDVSEFVLLTVGIVSCLYAIYDIKSDVLDRQNAPSDAAMLAELTGIPTVLWGVLWIAIALLVTWRLVLIATRQRAAKT